MKKFTKQLVLTSLLVVVLVFASNAQTNKTNQSDCPRPNGLTEPEISSILDEQNKLRADVGLPKLAWNCKLADLAQEWATRGIFEHRKNRIYGENLYSSTDTAFNPVIGIQDWLSEKPFWNNSTATCQTGKTCRHYTQIVWRETTEVGCGINRNAPGEWKILFVCNYNPAGNGGGKAY